VADNNLAAPDGFVPAHFSPGFLEVSGPYFLKQAGETAIIGCRIADHHMNYIGVAHGGVLATLADVALSYQLYNSEDPPLPVATAGMTTSFLAGAKLGDWIEASGTIDRMGKRLAYVHGSICCGDRLLMTMSGIFTIIRPQ
jgi:acyl-coenzyme A thioesterase 13